MPDIWMDVDVALSEVPINKLALTDDGDFKTREETVVFNQAGLDLLWNFVTTAGAFTQTAVTPTDTGGNYDWVNQGNGYYTIEIPDSGGASINNDTEGVGWFSGYATGILPWSGPIIGFRAVAISDFLINDATALDIALKKALFADGKVYVDPGGTNSTAWPYGSAPYPTTTIANGKTIADANDLDILVVHGNLTMSAAMENYIFIGHGHMEVAHRININSQSVEHSVFKGLVVQGTMTNATGVLNISRFTDCVLWALSDIHGIATRGGLNGACSILDGGIVVFNNIGCGALAACTLTLQAPATCIIADMRGVLTVAGMDGGTAFITMAPGSTLTIDNTNTAGTITVSGDTAGLTDNNGGTTVVVVRPVANAVEIEGGDPSDLVNAACDAAFATWAPPTKAEMDTAHALLATEAKQDTIDTVVDGIQTDLNNVTDGLGALKALLDTIVGYTDLIDDVTNGLAAIKAEVEGLGGAAMRGTNNAALATALATHDTDIKVYVDLIDDATNGLAAIKAEVEGLAGAAMRGTDNAATEVKQDIIDTVVDGIQTDLSNAADGLGALKALIDALNDISVANIIAGIADGSYDLREMMRIIFSACCLKSAGGGTTTHAFRDSADSKDRISATVNAVGDRTAVALDGS